MGVDELTTPLSLVTGKTAVFYSTYACTLICIQKKLKFRAYDMRTTPAPKYQRVQA